MLRNFILFLSILALSKNAYALQTLKTRAVHELKDTNALLAMHAQALAERQAVLANNVSNANTPDFKARDVNIEATLRKDATRGVHLGMTSDRHIKSQTRARDIKTYKLKGDVKPNGNNVDIADQMARIGRTNDKYNEIVKSYMSSSNLISAATGAGQ